MNEYDVLKEAKARVTKGWYQDLAGTGIGYANGCECLLVAVFRAANEDYALESKVVKLLASLITGDAPKYYYDSFETITQWNDTRGRKFQEVIDLLDTAMSQFAPSGLDTSS